MGRRISGRAGLGEQDLRQLNQLAQDLRQKAEEKNKERIYRRDAEVAEITEISSNRETAIEEKYPEKETC